MPMTWTPVQGDNLVAKRKQLRTRKRRSRPTPAINPNAAGIDVGATEVYVAVPTDRDPEPVRTFATFTRDFHELAEWLQACGVKTVAMESTSVYWIPLYTVLELAVTLLDLGLVVA